MSWQGLAKGRSNKEIGADLFVSESTVKSHVRSIFKKLHAMSRTEAIAVVKTNAACFNSSYTR